MEKQRWSSGVPKLARSNEKNSFHDESLSQLAVGVILETCKMYQKPYRCHNDSCEGCAIRAECNRDVREFLTGDDFQFWKALGDLEVSGEAILEALEKNDGVSDLRFMNGRE